MAYVVSRCVPLSPAACLQLYSRNKRSFRVTGGFGRDLGPVEAATPLPLCTTASAVPLPAPRHIAPLPAPLHCQLRAKPVEALHQRRVFTDSRRCYSLKSLFGVTRWNHCIYVKILPCDSGLNFVALFKLSNFYYYFEGLKISMFQFRSSSVVTC